MKKQWSTQLVGGPHCGKVFYYIAIDPKGTPDGKYTVLKTTDTERNEHIYETRKGDPSFMDYCVSAR